MSGSAVASPAPRQLVLRPLQAPRTPQRWCPELGLLRLPSSPHPGTRSTRARSWPSATTTSHPWRTTTAPWPSRSSPSPSATSSPTCSQTASSRSDRWAGRGHADGTGRVSGAARPPEHPSLGLRLPAAPGHSSAPQGSWEPALLPTSSKAEQHPRKRCTARA